MKNVLKTFLGGHPLRPPLFWSPRKNNPIFFLISFYIIKIRLFAKKLDGKTSNLGQMASILVDPDFLENFKKLLKILQVV